RHARLAREIVLDVENRLTCNRLYLAPQVAVHGIAKRVLAHVCADAVTEVVGTYIGLKHRDDRRALIVGNTVERLNRLLGADNRLQDRMGRDLSILTLAGFENSRGL